MQELTTTANFVEYGTLEDDGPITAVLARSELEAALRADESAGLWFEFEREDEEMHRLTIELGSADLEEILRLSTGDEVVFAIDADPVVSLFDEPDVEAHGMRGALAIAVVAAAVAAPTSLAAAPQTASAAATAQRASAAATAQRASAAATAQRANAAATTQVASRAAKAQVSKSLVLKASGLRFLRGGLVR
jgi:hypothetical protein